MKTTVIYRVIFKNKGKFPIQTMCEFFNVSRSGYYEFVKRMNIPAKDLLLASKIEDCQKACHSTYGYRRMQIELEKQGIHRNPKTILRIMRKYNLLSVIRRKRYRKYSTGLHRYKNLLNRDFSTSRPNEKWATDISYIQTAQGVLYLSMIRDLFDNSIVGYKTSTRQSVSLVLDTIYLAKKKQTVTGELQLHSDQGFQYTFTGYFNLTKEYKITPSMSRRGNPYDNSLAENFFSILKTECIYLNKLDTFEQANNLIDEYIYFYNHHRIQLKTKLTPLEKRCQFFV